MKWLNRQAHQIGSALQPRWQHRLAFLPPLAPQAEAEFLADLAADRRILHWLDELDRRNAALFSQDTVDAIAALENHRNPSFRTLAARIVAQIPDDLLNPFREVDESPRRTQDSEL